MLSPKGKQNAYKLFFVSSSSHSISRKQQLADAGLRVLARDGARGLTHRAVDREAGFALGTATNYFKTRAALLDALGNRIFECLAPETKVFKQAGQLEPTIEQATEYIRDIVHRTTQKPELTLALFELRLEAARYPELADVLTMTLERNYQQDVAFHALARLPGGAWEVALLHYAIDGLLLDILTISIDERQQIEHKVEALVSRLLQPCVEKD